MRATCHSLPFFPLQSSVASCQETTKLRFAKACGGALLQPTLKVDANRMFSLYVTLKCSSILDWGVAVIKGDK